MKLKLALAAASMLVAPAFMTAQAQTSGVYVSGGYTQFEGDGGASLGGITGRVGVGFGPNFAVEGEGSFGVDDDSGTELDSELGAFVVGKLPINPSFDVFGRDIYRPEPPEISGVQASFKDPHYATAIGLIRYAQILETERESPPGVLGKIGRMFWPFGK